MRKFIYTVATLITFNAIAALPPPSPLAMCRPANAGANHYAIDIYREGQDYGGRLSDLTAAGIRTLSVDPIFMTATRDSMGCEIDVTNIDERCDNEWCTGPNSFLLELRPHGSHLYSVGMNFFNEAEGTMVCEFFDGTALFGPLACLDKERMSYKLRLSEGFRM